MLQAHLNSRYFSGTKHSIRSNTEASYSSPEYLKLKAQVFPLLPHG